MTKMTMLGSALLLAASSPAWAAEAPEPGPTAPEAAPAAEGTAPEAGLAASVPSPDTLAPVPTPPASAVVAPPAPPIMEPPPQPGVQPEPYTGWSRGRRAPMYLNLMLSVGALTEDGDNRLTTRDSKTLEGFGVILRLGAVLDEHHRLGARMQSFVRPTKKILLDPPAGADTNTEWGAVSFGYAGPEYLYTTDFGLYAGGSLGIGGLVSSSKNENDSDHKRDVERGSVGVAGIASLGYEWRANKWFAMNADAFGGYYHGVDDNENSMDSFIFGLAMGMGF